MKSEEWRDHDKFEEFLIPSLIELELPTNSEFILKLSKAYHEASKKLVYFRRDKALAKK